MLKSIKSKIIALNVLVIVAIAAMVAVLTAAQKYRLDALMGRELDVQNKQQIEAIAKDVFYMCRAQDEALRQKLDSDINVAEFLAKAAGGLSLDPKQQVEWTAVNQVSGEKQKLSLPQMMLGAAPIPVNYDKERASLLVDEVARLSGSTCTVFQRINPDGDMLRVCTNVIAASGKRAIGTYIPVQSAATDGSKVLNPIIKQVLEGKPYTGIAFVVDKWYITTYRPISDSHGSVVGMLYVGVRQESVASLRKGISSIKVGKSGYVFILGTEGKDKGCLVISKDGASDGKFMLDAKEDGSGRLFIKDMMEEALKKDDGEISFDSYLWKDDPKGAPVRKIAALTVYKPWKWVIGVSAYEDDFSSSRKAVGSALNSMMAIILGAAVAFLIIFTALAVFVSNRIVRPIVSASAMLKDIAQGEGDLTKRLQMMSNDEVAELSKWFNVFIDKLQSMIKSLAANAGSLAKTAKGFSAISGELNGNASQLDAEISAVSKSANDLKGIAGQVAVTAESMSSNSQGVSSSSTELSQNMATISAAVVEGQTNLASVASRAEEMSSTISSIADNAEKTAEITNAAVRSATEASERMNSLQRNSEEIGKIVETIEDIAEQTKLLALNATIEAARAGEAGKGFAVVAEEVKNLAQETNKATIYIRGKINEMRSSTSESAKQISDVGSIIGKVSSMINGISQSVEKQNSAMRESSTQIGEASIGINEISKNVVEANSGINEIAKNIAHVATGSTDLSSRSHEAAKASTDISSRVGVASGSISKTNEIASQLNQSAEMLSQMADDMNGLVGQFKV